MSFKRVKFYGFIFKMKFCFFKIQMWFEKLVFNEVSY